VTSNVVTDFAPPTTRSARTHCYPRLMRTLWLAVLGLIVVALAACRSGAPAQTASIESPAAALPEIRYYLIGDA
jgi:hypothetical protein